MNDKDIELNLHKLVKRKTIGKVVLTKDLKKFEQLEKENAKLKAELESEKRLTKQIDKHLFDKEKELLAEEKAELSLAELADKKGFTAIDIIIRNKDTNYSIYFYKLNKNNPTQGFDGRTYAEAEQKCFEHLRRIK